MFAIAISQSDCDALKILFKKIMPLLCDHVNPGELQMLTAALRSSCLASQSLRSSCLVSQSLRSSCLASQRLTVCYNHLPLPLGYFMKHPSHYCISYFRLHTSAACQLQEGDTASLSRTITKEEVLPSDILVLSFMISSSRSFNMQS